MGLLPVAEALALPGVGTASQKTQPGGNVRRVSATEALAPPVGQTRKLPMWPAPHRLGFHPGGSGDPPHETYEDE